MPARTCASARASAASATSWIRAAGLPFGTDGISFSDREDFFEELRLALYLQRRPQRFDQGRINSERVLRAAAVNGARAIGEESKLGSLEPVATPTCWWCARIASSSRQGGTTVSRSSTSCSIEPARRTSTA